MVFQRFNLFPHMTALENITLAPRKVPGSRKDEADASAAGAARRGSGSPSKAALLPAASCRAASSSGWRSPARWP